MDKKNIYHMYNNKTINKDSCVEVQLGKQKKKKYKATSVFFTSESFIQLEQTIWDNFREYMPDSVVKISQKEWIKIIQGLKELSELLKNTELNNGMFQHLSIKTSYDKKAYKTDFIEINKNINKMVIEFINWLEINVPQNEYITITA